MGLGVECFHQASSDDCIGIHVVESEGTLNHVKFGHE